MEKFANVTGLSSENKSLDIITAKNELEKKKKIYNSVKLSVLPDRGAKLKNQIDELENILKALNLDSDAEVKKYSEIKSSQKTSVSESKTENTPVEQEKTLVDKEKTKKTLIDNSCSQDETSETVLSEKRDLGDIFSASKDKKYPSFGDFTPKQTTLKNNTNFSDSPSFKEYRDPGIRKVLLTDAQPLIEKSRPKQYAQNYFASGHSFETSDECAKKIHHSLLTYPDDSQEESDPDDLKSLLMVHQKKGLAWLMWREQQDPSGGILADDMGLGKTLTIISLILKQKELHNYTSSEDNRFECQGTLIVCLASIIHQWKEEITKHCEADALKVCLYHGPKRDKSYKNMMTYDVVLTTYNILLSEKKTTDVGKEVSPLFKLKWERIVLDEAHTIKNYNSLTAGAVFSLKAFRRWAVTGTPIHNVFKDIYSLVKFLRFSPFDDFKNFKALTDENSESSTKRRNLLIKSIVLRRTKEQVDEWGKPLIEMRKKSITICSVELSAEERQIYDKFDEKVAKKFSLYFEKKLKNRSSSSLLVLLLRLQQCCNHLSLLEYEAEEEDSSNIADQLSSLTINESDSNSSSVLDLTFNELENTALNDKSIKSSKIKALFSKLMEISNSSGKKDKSVIVSQWVGMLDIVAYHLQQDKMAYHMIAGNTKVEDRQKFAEDFNYNEDGAKIMLLSLKAGGVGLNLIGANHLFLLDLHWNPALEMQACDRIHRVGQKKDVTIYKFVCKDTIEEKIKLLQDSKSSIASSALRGVKQDTRGLTMDDYKILFNVRK